MGRRKGRKRRRQRDRGSLGVEALRRSEARRRRAAEKDGFPATLGLPAGDDTRSRMWREPGPSDLLALARAGGEPRALPQLTCGDCYEFVPAAGAGRGRCLHPGSGVFSPWPDTEACQFHDARYPLSGTL